MNLNEILTNYIQSNLQVINLLLIIIVSFILFNVILKIFKKNLLKKITRKRQMSNVIVFLDLLKYIFVLFLVIIVVLSYNSTWGELGFFAGLLTIGLGWSLQKPISGVVAWLIIIIRKPFIIGDRVIISKIKGDITDITLTHIFLNEIGGTVIGEEKSGRTVMLPTSIIFDQEIINYTQIDDYILDEIKTTITYESNLRKAEEIIKEAVCKVMDDRWKSFPLRISRVPNIRLKMKESGIDVIVRYFTLTDSRDSISTDIVREIIYNVNDSVDVNIAYPHTELILPENKRKESYISLKI